MDKLQFVRDYSVSDRKYREENFDKYLSALVEISLLPFTLDQSKVEFTRRGIRWEGGSLSTFWLGVAIYDRFSALVFAAQTCRDDEERDWILRRERLSLPPSFDYSEDLVRDSLRTLPLYSKILEFQKKLPELDEDPEDFPPSYRRLKKLVLHARAGRPVATKKTIEECMIEDIFAIGDWRTACKYFPDVDGVDDLVESIDGRNFPVYKYCWLKNIHLPPNNFDDLVSEYYGRPIGFHPGLYPEYIGDDFYFRVLAVMLERGTKTPDEIADLIDASYPHIIDLSEYVKMWLLRNFNFVLPGDDEP
jgi:hypothetical protein